MLNKAQWILSLGFCQTFSQQDICRWIWEGNAGNSTDDTHITLPSFNHNKNREVTVERKGILPLAWHHVNPFMLVLKDKLSSLYFITLCQELA